ncbi:hypothetical protein VNO78_23519 [Psophocarpus tetragonolobus]|uniref:Bulb-type lectin domain-containing protein n=1 Tax=Psophocarpus tetragonolobus TaxID=3891 RepID=A0AAN9XDX9_PSOTE
MCAGTSVERNNKMEVGESIVPNGDGACWDSPSGQFAFDPTDTLLGGQSLPNAHQLVSTSSQNSHSSGRYRLKMQGDGNLVLYPVNTTDTDSDAYWASDTSMVGWKAHLFLFSTRRQLPCRLSM